jgi:hypothetical protein
MRFVVGPDHDDYDARLAHLIGLFVFRRVKQNGPLFGLADEAGVAHRRGDDDAAARAADARRPSRGARNEDIGPRSGTMHAIGISSMPRRPGRFSIDRPHHHLNMIGIVQAHAGRGHARTCSMPSPASRRTIPGLAGVTLTTELPKNVAIYEHFGYRVTGRVRVAPDLETWAMLQEPRRA